MSEEIKLLTDNLEKALEERWKAPWEKEKIVLQWDDDSLWKLQAQCEKLEFEK